MKKYDTRHCNQYLFKDVLMVLFTSHFYAEFLLKVKGICIIKF